MQYDNVKLDVILKADFPWYGGLLEFTKKADNIVPVEECCRHGIFANFLVSSSCHARRIFVRT